MNIANGKFTVDTEGNTEVKGWMVIQGKTTINADAMVQGNLTAGTIQNANESFKVDEKGKISADTVVATNMYVGSSEDENNAVATIGKLADVESGLRTDIGDAKFGDTKYASEATNVTEAIYAVDDQVEINSDALNAYKAAGIVAGNEVGQYSKAIALGDNATANGWSAVAFGSNANAKGSSQRGVSFKHQFILLALSRRTF